jgi:hypothetical protein
MNVNAFDIFMVIAVGSLAGTGIGLVIGFVAKKQGNATSIMTARDSILNFAMIVGCSSIGIVGLGWIFLS